MSLTVWPPLLADLKIDSGVPANDARDNDKLTQVLDAAIAFVERVHEGNFTFSGTPTEDAPAPDADMSLGTIRLALRWHTRRRSPEALVAAGEMGSSRVPSFDPDIDRMLRIGRFSFPVIA